MTGDVVYYKFGDTAEQIVIPIEAWNRDTRRYEPCDITAYSGTPKLILRRVGGTTVHERNAVRISPYTAGEVGYTPGASDWASGAGQLAPGRYEVEAQLYDGSGKRITAPTHGTLILEIGDDIAS